MGQILAPGMEAEVFLGHLLPRQVFGVDDIKSMALLPMISQYRAARNTAGFSLDSMLGLPFTQVKPRKALSAKAVGLRFWKRI